VTKIDRTQATAARRTAIDPAVRAARRERGLAAENVRTAWGPGQTTHGAPGVEGMTIEDCPALAREHWPRLRQAVRDETSQPAPVRRTEMPKRHGPGQRRLGMPTVVDRGIQHAIAPGRGPRGAPGFSAARCGVRPGRAAPHAVKQRQRYINRGSKVAVDRDLAKVFDRGHPEALRARGARQVRDKAGLRLRGQ
jgi:RNA-directed DNA polymerase